MQPLDPSQFLAEQVTTRKNPKFVAYAKRVWTSVIAEVEALPFGVDLGEGRNDALFKAVARLANFIPAPWLAWTDTEIRSAVAPLAVERLIPGWAATIDSAIDTGRDSPATVPLDLANSNDELRNFKWVQDEAGKYHKERKSIADIRGQILEVCEGWPKRLGEQLFCCKDGKVRWLADATALACWLDEHFTIEFASSAGVRLPTMAEVYASLLAHSEQLECIETTPHYPPITGVYYVQNDLEASDGATLREFAKLLNPETSLDLQLLIAALLTPSWGGPPGERPLFVFTSKFGRGAGKTATAQAICALYGGAIEILPRGMDWTRVVQRLLSTQAAEKRCVLIDNAKGRLDAPELESAITTPSINGHALWVGESRRPNYLTWLLTSNTPSLSSDLAQRSVIIRLGKPNHKTPFKRDVRRFFEARGRALIADVLGVLQRPSNKGWQADRFFEWQAGVLSKLSGVRELCTLIRERREGSDDEAADVGEVAKVVRALAASKGKVLFSANELIFALREVWPEVASARQLWTRLEPLLGNGELAACERVRGGRRAAEVGGCGLFVSFR